MVSSYSVKPFAPSPNLLRYLRFQFDNLSLTSHRQSCGPALTKSTSYRSSWSSKSYKSGAKPGIRLYHSAATATTNTANKPSSIPIPLPSLSRRRPTSSSGCHPYFQNGTISKSEQRVQPFSITSNKDGNFFRRFLWFSRSNQRDTKLKPDDLPNPTPVSLDDGLEANPFNTGRNSTLKASNEPRLRCTEFDEKGKVTLVNGELKKSELIAKYGLLPRDLRKIDSSVLPHILVRHSAILISLLHLRVLIKANRVLVFDAYGSADTYTQSLFMYDLEGKLRQKEPVSRQASTSGSLPYEFRALEAVLVSITSGLEAEFEGVREPVVRVLRALEEDIDRDKLRHLLIYSKRLGTFEQKARLVRDAIEDLLEADDDLTAMYLTERGKEIVRAEHDHQEVEMLLESYHKVCDEIVQASGNLVTNIRNTEEVMKAILDANRNSLMLLELKFSIGTLGLAAGTLCSALYGMNLKNFFEESDIGFGTVSGICFALTAFVCTYGLVKLRKVQRVRMWGEGGLQDGYMRGLGGRGCSPAISRGNWRSDSVDPIWTGIPGEGRAQRLRRLRGVATTPSSGTPSSVGAAVAGGAQRTARNNMHANASPLERDHQSQRTISSNAINSENEGLKSEPQRVFKHPGLDPARGS